MMIYHDFPSLEKLNENYFTSVRGLQSGLNYVYAVKSKNTSSILDFDLSTSPAGRKPLICKVCLVQHLTDFRFISLHW